MTHVVTDNCIRCKHMECVTVCPVDCFHEGENMLVIDPDECIDCGVCVPECPYDAIFPHSSLDEDEYQKWLQINKKYSSIWPVIDQVIEHRKPQDSDVWDGVENKYEKFFSNKPGE